MEKPSTARLALKWGLITALSSVIYATILYTTGLWKNQGLMLVVYLILALGIVMVIREFKASNHGFVSYGEGLGLGSLLSAVSGLITAIYGYTYNNIVDKTMPQQILDFQRTKMEEQGLSEEQLEQAMQMTAKFMSPSVSFLLTVLGTLFVGFILSLIIAAIMRKNKPALDF